MAKSNGITGKIVAGALALAVAAGGICCLGYASRDNGGKWFGGLHWSDKDISADINGGQGSGNGGAIVTEGECKDMSIKSAMIAAEDYAAYGIDGQSVENAYALSVTYTPADTTFQETVYEIGFAEESEWSADKYIGDYATVTQSAVGSKDAVLTILQPFGGQISVMATSERYPTKYAVVTVDYVRGVDISSMGYDVSLEDYDIRDVLLSDATANVDLLPYFEDFQYTTGTLDPDVMSGSVTLTLDSGFVNYLANTDVGKNALYMDDVDDPLCFTGEKVIEDVTIDGDYMDFGLSDFLSDYIAKSSSTGSGKGDFRTAFLTEMATYYDGQTDVVIYTITYSDIKCKYNGTVTSSYPHTLLTVNVSVPSLKDYLIKATALNMNVGSLIFSDNGWVE